MKQRFPEQMKLFSTEMDMLLRLLRLANGDERLLSDRTVLENVDWEQFIHWTVHHRVYPGVYFLLKKAEFPEVPGFVKEALQREYRKNAFRMLHLTGEMERLCEQMANRGVRSLVLKGPTLAFDLHGDVSLRTSKDLDILVPIDDLDKVDALMEQLGYKHEDYIAGVLSGWRWRYHHVGYYHPVHRTHLELHWRLAPGPAKEPGFDELWERRRRSGLTKFPVHYLGAEHLLLYLISHGARHGWFRIRWLADVDALLKQPIDWPLAESLLTRYQAVHTGGQALLLANELLGTPLPEEASRLVDSRRAERLAERTLYFVREMVENPPAELERKHKRYLFSAKTARQKVLHALSFLYPYPKDAETLPLPKPIHFLYFPLRPFLWMWRKARKSAWTS